MHFLSLFLVSIIRRLCGTYDRMNILLSRDVHMENERRGRLTLGYLFKHSFSFCCVVRKERNSVEEREKSLLFLVLFTDQCDSIQTFFRCLYYILVDVDVVQLISQSIEQRLWI